jgi:hypothetical protein
MDGTVVDVLDLSDFAFDAPYRTLGPALRLLRATLEPVNAGEFAFSYDHPSRAMLALYRRMGGRDVSTRRRWVRLLRPSVAVAKRLGNGRAAKLAGSAGDTAVRWRDRLTRRATRIEVAPLAWGEAAELDALDARLGLETRFRVRRSSAHVCWRYLGNVTARHDVLCAKERDKIIGYLVFRPRAGGVLSIVDLVGRGAGALIAALAELGHARGASALWCTALRGSPAERPIARNGFVTRDEAPGVVVYAPRAPAAMQDALQEAHNWWMLEGDEDV